MSRMLLALLLFALFGIGVTLFFEQDNGYVLLRYQDTVLETSLVFLLVAIVVLLWAVLLILRALRMGIGLPAWLTRSYQQRQQRKERQSMLKGLSLLLEGRWSEAEKALARRAREGETARLNYLNAAIAAQRLNNLERRDQYLLQAAANSEEADDVAVLLTRAELQLEAGQETQAVATLELLHNKQPDHAPGLAKLLQACARVEDWALLRSLWGEGKRLKALPENELLALGCAAYGAELTSRATGGVEALETAWRDIPRDLRDHPDLKLIYARLLSAHPDGHPLARRVIQQTLKQSWHPELAMLYADLEADDSVSQLSAVEGWIKQHGEAVELQILAGRLCLRNKLWGRARSYLQSAIAQQADARAWQALGQLHQQTGDAGDAAEAYAKGLAQALEEGTQAANRP